MGKTKVQKIGFLVGVVAMLLIGVYLAKRKKSVEVRGDEGSNGQL